MLTSRNIGGLVVAVIRSPNYVREKLFAGSAYNEFSRIRTGARNRPAIEVGYRNFRGLLAKSQKL